jgi:hypothetical protein
MNNFKKLNQKGFGAIEALLILIIVAGLGFVGWYVMNSNKQTKDQVSNIDKSTVKTAPTTKSIGATMVFKELGVEFKLSNDLTDLSYNVTHFSDGDSLALTSPSFKTANEQCYGEKVDGEGPSFAAISRGNGQFKQNQMVEVGLLKQFPDFYISISYPNGITACVAQGVDSQMIFETAHKLQQAFVDSFQKTAILAQ